MQPSSRPRGSAPQQAPIVCCWALRILGCFLLLKAMACIPMALTVTAWALLAVPGALLFGVLLIWLSVRVRRGRLLGFGKRGADRRLIFAAGHSLHSQARFARSVFGTSCRRPAANSKSDALPPASRHVGRTRICAGRVLRVGRGRAEVGYPGARFMGTSPVLLAFPSDRSGMPRPRPGMQAIRGVLPVGRS